MKETNGGFPRQQLSFASKGKKWRKQCVDWGANNSSITYSSIRKSVIHKKINYDLLNGILHMSDLELVYNPDSIDAGFIPDKIQHYPIMNSKLNVLRGEEYKRPFDYRAIVTNPSAISEMENTKKEQVFAALQQMIMETAQSEDDFNQKLMQLGDYFTYEYQDQREVRANYLLNHYVKELSLPFKFNSGIVDGMAVGEELYQVDIVEGEPTVERLNNMKVRIYRNGYSNKVEDADVIVIDDFWSPGRIIDTYFRWLSPKDIKYIEDLPYKGSSGNVDEMDNVDDRAGFVNAHMISDVLEENVVDTTTLFAPPLEENLLPYDLAGNIRVCKVYWKSRRMIKEVKSYDPITGEEVFKFYPETYVPDESLGEEVQTFWINEAWEGVRIGEDIYVNMRPRPIQFNRMSNPSRCHFGIIGSIYNINDDKPFSLVDMMKKYNYLYDVIHYRLNILIARNWGKIAKLDLAKIPAGWTVDKWMYYARVNGLAVEDSFKEGDIGAATGKLAGGLNNASSGVLDAEAGNSIQQLMNLLEFIKLEMSEVAGISKQREGQISNRETVGGVERATLQSSHITEWLFIIHEDVKRRVLDALIETAKICLRGRKKKFQYILPDGSMQLVEIDGDEFAENDYGIVVDNSNATVDLNSKIDALAQAGLQNQLLRFSTVMKLYSSYSITEKIRMIEKDERETMERAAQSQQQQLQAEQQRAQMEMQAKQQELQLKDEMNNRDNETKILVATIAANAKDDGIEEPVYSQEAKDKLLEQMRETDLKLQLEREKFTEEKRKNKANEALKLKQINKKTTSK